MAGLSQDRDGEREKPNGLSMSNVWALREGSAVLRVVSFSRVTPRRPCSLVPAGTSKAKPARAVSAAMLKYRGRVGYHS